MDAHAPKGHRLLAYLIDLTCFYAAQFFGAYVGAFAGALIMTLRHAPQGVVEEAAMRGMNWGILFWGFAFWLINYGLVQGMTGSSLGKRILGIQVLHESGRPIGVGRSIARSFCYVVSALPLYIGFVILFWTKRSQCLHDLICQTVVVRRFVAVAEVIPLPAPQQRPSTDKAA